MFAFYARRKFHLLSFLVAALAASLLWGFSPLLAVSIGVFIVVVTGAVFNASRDKVTTMSLLPLWIGKDPKAGKQ